MSGMARELRIFGTPGSAAAYTIRDFLQRSDVPFQWIELTSDEPAQRDAAVSGLHDPKLPVCVLADGTRLERPTLRQITEKLGWFRDPSQSEYHVVTGADLLRDGRWPTSWQLDRAPYYLETSGPGIFAAGDVRHGSVKRCASAVGEGGHSCRVRASVP